MKLEGILPFARTLIEKAAGEGDTVIDCTVGNGHDTLFLAKLVGPTGQVYGFDVQQEAIESTVARLTENDIFHVELFLSGHEHLDEMLQDHLSKPIKAAIFNLGYLPHGDKSICTKAETTIAAIEQLLNRMEPEGIIVLVIYHGHPEGGVERDTIMQYVQQIPQDFAHVLEYRFINQMNQPPFIIAIEKR